MQTPTHTRARHARLCSPPPKWVSELCQLLLLARVCAFLYVCLCVGDWVDCWLGGALWGGGGGGGVGWGVGGGGVRGGGVGGGG